MLHVSAGIADHYHMPGHQGRPGAGIGQRVIDDAVRLPDLPPGRSVQRVHHAVQRGHIDPLVPYSHATIDDIATRIAPNLSVHMRIEFPDFPPGGGIQRIDKSPGAGRVHHAIDHHRRRLLAASGAQIILPGKPQLRGVDIVDARQRREIRAVRVTRRRRPIPRPRRAKRHAGAHGEAKPPEPTPKPATHPCARHPHSNRRSRLSLEQRKRAAVQTQNAG